MIVVVMSNDSLHPQCRLDVEWSSNVQPSTSFSLGGGLIHFVNISNGPSMLVLLIPKRTEFNKDGPLDMLTK
jgi:hypothetical protein